MGDSSWFGLDEIVLEIRGFKYECFNFFLDFVVCVFISNDKEHTSRNNENHSETVLRFKLSSCAGIF